MASLQQKDVRLELPSYPSLCGKMEPNVDYADDGGWAKAINHIESAEMCCALCQGEPPCRSFTWVKDAGLKGEPGQCWLKGAESPVSKIPKAGVISGVPPPRRAVQPVAGAPVPGVGSMLCFSLVVPGTVEPSLLKWQSDNGMGIFACDEATVYSNTALTVAPGVVTKVVNSSLHCEKGGDSNTAMNSWIFIAVWYEVIREKAYAKHFWTVKVDPDAAFFANRLRAVLAQGHGGDAYVNNCRFGMHGPVEVFSKRAVDALAQDYAGSADGRAPKRCVTEQHIGLWGEDMFLDKCLKDVYGLTPRSTDERLMCEAHCHCPAWYWCQNGTDTVSFHPFKTVDSYSNCVANALQGPIVTDEKAAATPPPSAAPTTRPPASQPPATRPPAAQPTQ